MGNFNAKRHNIGKPVRPEELRQGLEIHLSYTNFANYWVIVSLENINGVLWMNLRAPISGKTKRTKAEYAVHLRRNGG